MEYAATLVSPAVTRTAVRIRDSLLADIVALRLPPGAKISENEVARRFGVSRQPVREAVVLLSTSGLVHTEAHRSTVVLPISMDGVLQRFFVREAIEIAVVTRAAASMPEDARSLIDQTLTSQHAAAVAGETEQFSRLDAQLHELLCIAAQVGCAWQTLWQIRLHALRVCAMVPLDTASMIKTCEEHARIMTAIAAGNGKDAAEQMRAHLSSFPKKLEAAYARYIGYFEA